MRLFAIGDLHLPGQQEKPMDVFGPQWNGHFFRLSGAWREKVAPEDTVLIPGDISWAMTMEQVRDDLQAIGELPGRKILLKGNHDYWWSSLTRVRSALPAGMSALQNDAVDIGPAVICGTRGWMIPTGDTLLSEQDEKLYRREAVRLSISIDAAEKIARGRPVIAMFHFPPLYGDGQTSAFSDLLEERGIRYAVYGHLHGKGIAAAFNGTLNGVRYQLVSADGIDFSPVEILSFN